MNEVVLLSALMVVIIGTIGTVLAEEPDEQTVDLIADGGSDESLDLDNISRLIQIISKLKGQFTAIPV